MDDDTALVDGSVSSGNGLKEGPARWHPVGGPEGEEGGLKVSNSLCNDTLKRVPFVSVKGKQVSWYTCGPTVYDSSHVGHARTYLSFDIIRRILEDYFGYRILYVMNITDVDDKVIKRARQNFLLHRYAQANNDPRKVLVDVQNALDRSMQKQRKKVEDTKREAQSVASSQQKTELATQVQQEELKVTQLEAALKELKEKMEPALKTGGEEGVQMLLAIGKDAIAAELDEREGKTITDHSIFRAHTAKYEQEFWEDMDALGVRRPDIVTRVTEYISEIIEYVKKIEEKGLAYFSNDSVYFDTRAFIAKQHRYGKLNPVAVGSAALASESEADFETSEKRDKKDFALWKKSKPGEPFWDSPWGEGRPGWHIECSAMASNIIGGNIDIHSGGMDLKFPHHDNELAQAEAYHDNHQWVNYFLHTGHLHIEGLKMSKSLKNFITIRQALEKYTARQIRLLFCLQSWDKAMNFGESAMAETLVKEKQFKSFFQNVHVALREAGVDGEERWEEEEKHLHTSLLKSELLVQERLEDNFDTAGAILSLSDLITSVNVYLSDAKIGNRRPRALLIRKAALFVTKIFSVFGVVEGGGDQIGFGSAAGNQGSLEATLGPHLDALLAFRDQVRRAAREGAPKEDILSACDKMRDYTLADLGVRCEDTAAGSSVWKMDDPDLLRKEREEKEAKAHADSVRKLETKRAAKVKETEKWARDRLPPRDMFAADAHKKYAAFDGSGLPTHDAGGKELSKGARKQVEKEFKKQQESHDKYLKKLAAEPQFLQLLDEEIASLDGDLLRLKAQTRQEA